MDLGGVIDFDQKRVEGIDRFALLANGREGGLGGGQIRLADGVAKLLAGRLVGRELARLHRLEHFRLLAADFLQPRAVSHQHLHDGQRLALGARFLGRHLVGRREGHQGVEADVVLAAEGSGIGERCRGREGPEIGAVLELVDHLREQFGGGRFLQEGDERFQVAEGNVATVIERGKRKTEVGGQARSNGGGNHAATNIGKQFTASTLRHREFLPVGLRGAAVVESDRVGRLTEPRYRIPRRRGRQEVVNVMPFYLYR